MHPRFRSFIPWLALSALWLAFAIPLSLCALRPDPSRLRLELELPLLWTLARLNARPRWAILAAATILLLYRADQWLCLLLMREEPLLYDQWFMARHLGVLIGDLLSPSTLAVLLGVALASWAVVKMTRAALRVGARASDDWRVLAVFWACALGASLATTRVGWLSADIVANVRASAQVYRRVSAHSQRWPRAELMRRSVRAHPDVLLFIVESYGRLLSVDADTRSEHQALLHTLERELADAGWSMASAFGSATVSGGRSWIAEATLLTGMPIHYEAEFQHLLAERPPNLVQWLAQNGYRTLLLAPADRDRPGAHVVNRWRFDAVIAHAQLDYRGAPIGWGIVPDQFSLDYAARNLLGASPVFLDFHMVSSHAPWTEVPRIDAASPEVPSHARIPRRTASPLRKVLAALSFYDRSDGRHMRMGQLDASLRAGYQATVSYDLRLIARYLATRERDALVIVLGDHQPPVLARADQSFDTPIHVLSRAPARLAQLRGFTPGLWLAPDAAPALHHAELWPRLVDALTN